MRWLFSALAVVLIGIVPASAQTAQASQGAAAQQAPAPLPPEPEGLTFTPFVDVGFSGDYENSPAGFGAALGYGVNERVSFEGEFSLTPDGDQGLGGGVESTVWSLSGDVLYHFFAEDVTPYVALGLGVLAADTNAEDLGLAADDTAYEMGWNWGGGLKTAVNDRFGLRADLRYFTGDDLAPDHWRAYGGVIFRQLFR